MQVLKLQIDCLLILVLLGFIELQLLHFFSPDVVGISLIEEVLLGLVQLGYAGLEAVDYVRVPVAEVFGDLLKVSAQVLGQF